MTSSIDRYLTLVRERPADFVQSDALKLILDPAELEAFQAESGRTMGVAFESPYHLMVVDLVEAPDGTRFAYERVLPAVAKGAVVVIPRLQDGRLVLLKQFRHSLRGMQYAFPRGYAEPGLPPDQNAVKELCEELGASTAAARKIGTVVADSGLCGDTVFVYECQIESAELKHVEGIQDLAFLTEDEFCQWVSEGRINDGYTLAALMLLKNRAE